jgi:hypothetical protein
MTSLSQFKRGVVVLALSTLAACNSSTDNRTPTATEAKQFLAD